MATQLTELTVLRQEREQLQKEVKDWQAKLFDSEVQTADLDVAVKKLKTKNSNLETENERLQAELENLRSQPSPSPAEFPEASDLLNRLKAMRKGSKASLADVEAILELLDP
ncbi:MAG: hypothetical protein ACM37W_22985 [Actinomycetota bacterium]